MQTSDTIAAIAAALAKAQGELGNTTKDQRAQAGRAQYSYANIASVLSDVRPVLSRHGLAVVQAVGRDGEDVAITTRLMHDSGEWIESTLPLPVDRMGGIQGVGSAITYGRRYGLQAMLGIASDDDDGAAAQAQQPSRRIDVDRLTSALRLVHAGWTRDAVVAELRRRGIAPEDRAAAQGMYREIEASGMGPSGGEE